MFYVVYRIMNKRYAAGPYAENQVMSQVNDLQYDGVFIEKIIPSEQISLEKDIIFFGNV